MKLTQQVKQRIFDFFPEELLKKQFAKHFFHLSVNPKGKTHQERAAWWAQQSDAYFVVAFHRTGFNYKQLDSIAKLVRCKIKANADMAEMKRMLRQHLAEDVPLEEFERSNVDPAFAGVQPHTAGPGQPTFEMLWKEGERLSKPVMYLEALKKPTRATPKAGIWTFKDKPKDGVRPWAIIDLRHHPEKALRADGILQIDQRMSPYGFESTFHRKPLPAAEKGQTTLYAVETQDLPSPEILMKKAKASIRKWEAQMQGRQLLDYENKWSEGHPYHKSDGGDVYVQLGGWPVTWPEEGATEQLRKNLVLRTYANSEPWIEVFKRGERYECIERIT